MPDCIGINASIVYTIQCIIAVISILGMVFAFNNREFPAQFRITMFISAFGLLITMVLISKLAFAGIGSVGDLSQTNCNSAIYMGK
jgi:amino acid transporter